MVEAGTRLGFWDRREKGWRWQGLEERGRGVEIGGCFDGETLGSWRTGIVSMICIWI